MPYDQTADIYSLGMVLYYLANDFKLPFSEIQSSIDRINRRMNGDTEWDWRQKLSSWGIATNIKQKMSEEILYDTVMTACANDPKARYQSATAMKRDLMICMDKICTLEKRDDNWGSCEEEIKRRTLDFDCLGSSFSSLPLVFHVIVSDSCIFPHYHQELSHSINFIIFFTAFTTFDDKYIFCPFSTLK